MPVIVWMLTVLLLIGLAYGWYLVYCIHKNPSEPDLPPRVEVSFAYAIMVLASVVIIMMVHSMWTGGIVL